MSKSNNHETGKRFQRIALPHFLEFVRISLANSLSEKSSLKMSIAVSLYVFLQDT
jgi:hypothetical protein